MLANASTGAAPAPRARAPATMARAMGCSLACSSDAASRSSVALGRSPRRRRRRPGAIWPVVTVPVLSSTMVSTRRVDSSTSGPLMRMPSCAPRPVPTMRAVGVARPRAQGQAMISTATAAVNATVGGVGGGGREPEPEGGGGQGDARPGRRRRHPIGQPLHRGLAGLGVLDQAGDLGQRGVGADAGGSHDEAAAGVDGGAGDGVAGADLDGHGLAGEQRGVDGGGALDDDAVGGDLLARAARRSGRPPTSVLDGMRTSLAVAQHGDVLGPELEQGRSAAPDRRLARASA